jgi:hypothetical protein
VEVLVTQRDSSNIIEGNNVRALMT